MERLRGGVDYIGIMAGYRRGVTRAGSRGTAAKGRRDSGNSRGGRAADCSCSRNRDLLIIAIC